MNTLEFKKEMKKKSEEGDQFAKSMVEFWKPEENMKKESKIPKGNFKETIMEMTPLAVKLLDPEIISNPLSVVAKVGQGITSHFLRKFFSEYKRKINNGELRKEKFSTEKPKLIFADLLRIIDEGKIDEERFGAMKSIFYMAIEKNANREREEMAYRLFQTAKQLSSEEILILCANYKIVKGESKPTHRGIDWSSQHTNVGDWTRTIAEQVGHNLSDLILQYEQHLISLRLISDRHYPSNSNTTRITDDFEPTSYYRLTDLGYKLCEFIIKHDTVS